VKEKGVGERKGGGGKGGVLKKLAAIEVNFKVKPESKSIPAIN
jgi:hypothetical protein